MSFPAYESYKESGVEWLGRVPSHWEVLKLERVTIAKCDGPFGSGLKSEHYADEGVRVVRLQNIKAGAFDGADAAYVSQAYFDTEIAGHEVIEGDLLLAGLGDDRNIVGRACVAPRGIEPAMVKADCFRFRLDVKKVLVGFVAQQLTASANFDAGVLSTGSTRSRIPLMTMATRKVALPPLGEQRIIAAFLDRETAKIDALVEAQERLIALLKEKRQAVISHAVTKGLDPSAPMKDSGVEWLGQIPAHWGVTRVKYAASHVVDCLHTTPTYDGEIKFPAVRTADVERGRLLLDGARLVSREIYEERIQRLRPETDDILYTREGERFGLAALVPPGVDLCLGQRMMMFRIASGHNPAYVMWVLNSDPIYQRVISGVTGATAPHVNISEVINFHLPVPPLHEQGGIAAQILASTAALDRLAAEAEAAITLLQERRAALISAAVTGKIDVRGLVQTAEAA